MTDSLSNFPTQLANVCVRFDFDLVQTLWQLELDVRQRDDCGLHELARRRPWVQLEVEMNRSDSEGDPFEDGAHERDGIEVVGGHT